MPLQDAPYGQLLQPLGEVRRANFAGPVWAKVEPMGGGRGTHRIDLQ